jgi:taurine transport system substrate-binding protein
MNGKLALSRARRTKTVANMGVVTMAGGSILASRNLFAQQATAMSPGHFGSANRRLCEASGAFKKAYGDKVKTEFVTVGAGPQVIAAIAGNALDICNIGSSPMVVGFAQGVKMSMVLCRETSPTASASRCATTPASLR